MVKKRFPHDVKFVLGNVAYLRWDGRRTKRVMRIIEERYGVKCVVQGSGLVEMREALDREARKLEEEES